MKRLLGIALAALIAVPAAAAPYQDKDGRWWDIQTPPMAYFNRPKIPFCDTPQDIGFTCIDMQFLPRPEVHSRCLLATGLAEQHGCALPQERRWLILIVNDAPKPLREALQIHEVGHVYGWPADHPR